MNFQNLADNLISKLANNDILIQEIETISNGLNTTETVVNEMTVKAAISKVTKLQEQNDHFGATFKAIFSAKIPGDRLKKCKIIFKDRRFTVSEIDPVGTLENEATCWRLWLNEF